MDVTTAEHLIYYMKHNLRLSRYDSKFLENIEQIAHNGNNITSNQVSLFQKIIGTYAKQFAIKGMYIDELVKLPWETVIVPSNAEYVDTFITIDNNSIRCKAPYNRGFIQTVTKSDGHNFVWDTAGKAYVATFGTRNLKFVITATKKHFNNIHHCPVTTDLLNSIYEYEDIKHWAPTLLNNNGKLFLAALTLPLAEAISHIELNLQPRTLAELVSYGITIDESVKAMLTSELELFAAQFNPIVELGKVVDIVPWLQELGCECVYFSGASIFLASKVLLRKQLNIANISCYDANDIEQMPDASTFKFSVVIRFRTVIDAAYEPYRVTKIIKLVDSRPVTIR